MSLTHYSLSRHSFRFSRFWSGRGLSKDLEGNQSELMTRADVLLDGLVMLVPNESEAQKRLIRESVVHLKKAMMVIHGAFILQERNQ